MRKRRRNKKKLHTIVAEQKRLMDDKDLVLDEFEKVFRMKKELFIANDKGIIGGHYAV